MKNFLQKIAIIIVCCCFAVNSNGQTLVVDSILSPQPFTQAGVTSDVIVRVVNNGVSTANNYTVSYRLNGGPSFSSSVSIPLGPSQAVILTLPPQMVVPMGQYDLCISVDSVNGVATYDTTCVILSGQTTVQQMGYSDNFDSINVGWYQNSSNPNTQWQLGTPNFGVTNSTHSGINSWDINLNTGYDTSAYVELYSPYFDVMGTNSPKLSFWQNRNTEAVNDGFRMEYCANGAAWHVLGIIGDPLGINWYTNTITSSGLPGWEANSGGWQQSHYDLQQFAGMGLIQFRYVFTSDAAINSDGVSIDDFSIYDCGIVANLPASFPICVGNSALLCPTVSGGVAPLTYQWNTGSTSSCETASISGVYSVTVIDANGCSASCSTIVIVNPNPVPVISGINIICQGGSTTFDAGGSYTFYMWSDGTTTQTNTVSVSGTYTVTVTDVNGCTGTATLNLSVNQNPSPIITGPSSICPGAGTILDVGAGFITYQWSTGNFTQTINISLPGTYIVTVADINGCAGTDTFVVASLAPILTIDSVIASGCSSNDGSFYFSTNAVTYTPYVNGVASGSTTNLSAGVYSLYLIDGTCSSDTIQIVVPDSCADVWPGDANYDLQADNKDLLQIGLAYGNTGPVRPSASSVWIAQPAPDWSNWFNIGVNQKHADCDGNGIIDANDTIPIMLNYGLTHLLKQVIIPQVNTLAPDLYLVITQDTTGLTDSVFVNVMCGTATDPVDSIYGLAFRLYYDSALVDTSSIFFDVNNSFIGTTGTNAISINKNFGVGYADFAITRTDHINASGFGPVCVMGIVTTDNVAGKMITPVNTVLRFSLGDVYALTANENPVVLDAFGDSIFIDSTMTGINNLSWEHEVKVYPNPVNNYFTVASSLTNILKISMLNQFGEVIYKNEKPRLPQRINISNITNGIYFLRIESKEGVMYKKIEIIR
ncbi:MAG: T9SS type A sorting domain-containing protein [Bacteroidia bacterium]